ncbi:hypothetical protein Ddye_022055 [Dipteronia dyeriana]|uniref:Uncharacterized protein n=1 Tax=Dipteronia dyeriana TaxID=168575 RepID=A0AAD9WYK6_9ROSI|nr:hypothetical protein Ddye_022055 [Dipteronia dyeriana]
MKLNLASKKLMIKFWVVLAVLVFLLSLVAARGGAGGGQGGRGGRGGHGSTWGRGVLGAGSHRGGGGDGHRMRISNEASTPSGANAWLSWSLGFFAYVALIFVEIVIQLADMVVVLEADQVFVVAAEVLLSPFARVFIDVVLKPAGRHCGGFGGRPCVLDGGGRGSTTLGARSRHGGGGILVSRYVTLKFLLLKNLRLHGTWWYQALRWLQAVLSFVDERSLSIYIFVRKSLDMLELLYKACLVAFSRHALLLARFIFAAHSGFVMCALVCMQLGPIAVRLSKVRLLALELEMEKNEKDLSFSKFVVGYSDTEVGKRRLLIWPIMVTLSIHEKEYYTLILLNIIQKNAAISDHKQPNVQKAIC